MSIKANNSYNIDNSLYEDKGKEVLRQRSIDLLLI
ncbi:uncharacterized protein METZ01_LOCUS351663 [marine metagenome]|uniref:Uncharacterized protein n=1 Tax=marine metagenome TaxID=408172 RepID=A0A382RM96_9ZZZZ